ncbi:MAG: hypothetical protein RM338_30295 [Nostoc sp. DedQUE12a]|nr:hypothetical protein [Nostoc sp. DedQUE12a]
MTNNLLNNNADVGYWSDGMLVRNLARRFRLGGFALEKLLALTFL